MYREFQVTGSILIRDAIFFFVSAMVVGMVINVHHTIGMVLGWIWFILLGVRVLSLVLMVLIPALRITGGMIMECVELLLTVYNMTIAPVIRLGMWVYRFLRQRQQTQYTGKNKQSSGSAGGQQNRHKDSGQSYHQQHNEQEERFHRRQQQRERDKQQQQEYQHAEQPKERSCYEILGISPDTDMETAKKAYRERCKEYHPDKVTHLGPKLRAVAEQELKDINEAWRQFQVLYRIF